MDNDKNRPREDMSTEDLYFLYCLDKALRGHMELRDTLTRPATLRDNIQEEWDW